MAENQQIQAHFDSARFKAAESGLCTLKHALIRQRSRPPNQNCADSTTASLGITARCVNWMKLSSRHWAHRAEAFRRKVLQMQLPPHGRDESLFHFRIAQCGVAIPDSAVHGIKDAMCKLGKLSSRHRAHRGEAFRSSFLPMAVTRVYSTFA